MSTKDFTANVISATKVVPDGNFKNSKASGIWDINEALDLIKGGNWPNVANTPPDAFVDALFSIDLWTGNDTERTITTGLDMSTNGGLVWLKNRDASASHHLFNTVSGATYYLQSNNTNAQDDSAQSLKSFGTTGFTIGGNSNVNNNGQGFCSWSFRKQPKFFDVLTYTGNGTAGRTVAHNLGSVPGMMIVKETNGTRNWSVYHRSLGATKYLSLNNTDAEAAHVSVWNDTAPTSSVFSVGTANNTNRDGGTYVAYLFAHNNNDGGFGEPGDQDIIKCDTYTGNGSSQDINVGFEPQFVMFKGTSEDNSQWNIVDTLRGLTFDQAKDKVIYANDDGAEASEDANIGAEAFGVTNTGFSVAGSEVLHNKNGNNYIYMAIRRGGMQTPTAASDVFAVDIGNNANAAPFEGYTAGFPVDMFIAKLDKTNSSYSNEVVDRVRGSTTSVKAVMETENTSAEDDSFDGGFHLNLNSNTGINHASSQNLPNGIAWMWKKARGYFDIVAYTGTGSNRTIAHNLGVVPEMMWVKSRTSGGADWNVYHSATGNGHFLKLNETDASTATSESSSQWNFTTPTSSVFALGPSAQTNYNGHNYIAYLFATVASVSKLGSYTGNAGASTINVDCGFTGDTPSFILIKESSGTGNWWVFDSARGIVAGTEKALYLNTTDAETSAYDYIDPYSGGFSLSINSGINTDGATFIFYAIAATS